MRLNFLWEIRWNELDVKFLIDMIVGIAMFLLGVFFDPIANKLNIHHSTERLPFWQISWGLFWGLYILWTYLYQQEWGEK